MAQVLHMDPGFPGKTNPPLSQEPYSVETPYGYRLDLDFLKYVNDIEKGNTMKRVPVQKRSRYSSLPRGYGYTGSWWTSTESLCSNTSMDSRHSSYSYCAPGFHAQQRPSAAFNLSAARVEKTLLDARRRLEEEKEGQKFSNLGSMHSSVVGSNTSLASGRSLGGRGSAVYTPTSSGLSTPISPSPAHLQHVREQMAAALRKIRELEEQVKTIPVLQVKISVLQEEKRQLSVQLKSQKFLGHTLGFGSKGVRTRGELYIDIPEEESGGGVGAKGGGGALSPSTPESGKQDSGCEIEDTVLVGGARPGAQKEVRSVGVGPEAESTRQVGVGVQEGDLGLAPEAEALRSRVEQLEGQLRGALEDLQAAQEQTGACSPQAHPAIRATSLTWQGGEGLQTVLSFSQQPLQRQQRTVGIQVYTPEQPAVLVGISTTLRAEPRATEAPPELPVAISSRQVREVLQKSEVSSSVPAPSRSVAMDTVSYQNMSLCQRLKEIEEASRPEPASADTNQLPEDPSMQASPQSALRSIMKRKAEGEPGSPTTKKNLQFVGVNGGYESTSSDDTSSESSEESDASEYHEAIERLPDTKAQFSEETSALGKANPAAEIEELNISNDPVCSSRLSPTSRPEVSTASPQPTETISSIQSPAETRTVHENVSPAPATDSAPQERPSQSPATAADAQIPSQSVDSAERIVGESPPPTVETSYQQAHNSSSVTQEARLELSESLMEALLKVQEALSDPDPFSQQEARSAYTAVLQTWLRISCHKTAEPVVVKSYLDAFASISPQLLEFVVNMADGNGNTAVHYTVSHSNFPVVKLLLDTGVCNADKQNKAGYTAIMLTALAAFHSDTDLQTVLQLLRTGDVNAKASQAGQTALMLAVSHGRGDMVRALLSCGAQVNIQDEDGSTALMCACEHGHVDIVRQLLSMPGCDANLADNDGSTALSIALEASQNDIAVLLYAHLNFAKPPSPVSPKASHFGSTAESK